VFSFRVLCLILFGCVECDIVVLVFIWLHLVLDSCVNLNMCVFSVKWLC